MMKTVLIDVLQVNATSHEWDVLLNWIDSGSQTVPVTVLRQAITSAMISTDHVECTLIFDLLLKYIDRLPSESSVSVNQFMKHSGMYSEFKTLLLPEIMTCQKGSALGALSDLMTEYLFPLHLQNEQNDDNQDDPNPSPDQHLNITSRLASALFLFFLSYLGGCIVILLLSLSLSSFLHDLLGSLPLAYLCTCAVIILLSVCSWYGALRSLTGPELHPDDLFMENSKDHEEVILSENSFENKKYAMSYIQLACTSGKVWVYINLEWVLWYVCSLIFELFLLFFL